MFRKTIPLLLFLFTAAFCFSQDSLAGYNDLYKYNFSICAEYQNLKPFSDYGTYFNMYYDISAIARIPIPSLPVFYLLIQAGLIQFITPERDNMEKWQHTRWYGLLGFGYSNRFSKSFELGAEIAGGIGEDPDAPRAIIRSIKFSKASIPPLFATMQSYYVKHPIGQATIENIEKFAINDIDVSFYQAGFIDSPVKAATIDSLSAREEKTINLYATFNEKVFKTEGTTPLTGEVNVSYISRGKAASQTFSVSYDLYDKTALTWNDDNKLGAFITPADSALRNYASFIRQSAKNYS